MRIIRLFFLLLLPIVVVACGKTLSGTYFDNKGSQLTFTSGGNWTSSNGAAGTYKIDGNLIFLSGFPMGLTISGTLESDKLTLNEQDLMHGKLIARTFTKDRPPPAEANGARQPGKELSPAEKRELVESEQVQKLVKDIRNLSVAVYGYQDKFRAMPGDDANAASHLSGATLATTPSAATVGNGKIDGAWDSQIATDEAVLFWQHVRFAKLISGPTTPGNLSESDPYVPKNSLGGRIGISGMGTPQIVGMTGTFQICTNGVPGNLAKKLDIALDDGNTVTGSVRVAAQGANQGAQSLPAVANSGSLCSGSAASCINDTSLYVVCAAH